MGEHVVEQGSPVMSGNGRVRRILDDVPALPKHPLALGDWRDGVLVRSPNWLGDAVMTLPALRQLRMIIPDDCGLFVVCPENLRSFFECLPIVDDIVPLERAHRIWRIRELQRVAGLLPGIGILFNNSFRDAAMLRLAGVPRLFGAAARCRSFLFARSYRFPARLSGTLNRPHHAARYLAIAQSLGAPPWDGIMPEIAIRKSPELIERLLLSLARTDRLLVLAAGAAYGAAKQWPPEYFKEVSRYWINEGGTVIVAGSERERGIGDAILDRLPPERCHNLAGQTDLQELMMLLRQAELCIANDSGIMHLSAALGKPGIAVFGSTDPESTGPVSDHWDVLFEKLDCSPCFRRECPNRPQACMTRITPDQVIERIRNRP